jgi:hypothetical protein
MFMSIYKDFHFYCFLFLYSFLILPIHFILHPNFDNHLTVYSHLFITLNLLALHVFKETLIRFSNCLILIFYQLASFPIHLTNSLFFLVVFSIYNIGFTSFDYSFYFFCQVIRLQNLKTL